MDYVLQTNNLTKQYRDFKAVDNLQMQIKKGRFMALSAETAPARRR